ncbi:MAG: glutamine amidotransferase-related protein, partial [Alphaproteobacteria bacterium]
TVLLVMQSERSNPGRIETLLAAKGWVPRRCVPKAGDALCDPAELAGAVVFGGPMSANDDTTLRFIADELRWIDRVLAAGTPFFGVCLGAQLMARALGARVAPHHAGAMEIGYWPVTATAAGEAVMNGVAMVYHWHGEGFDLPAGADLLATGETFPNQVMRFGANAYGVQFHPEVTPDILRLWSVEASEYLSKPGAQSYEQQLAGCACHDAGMDRWTEHFLALWLGPAPDP